MGSRGTRLITVGWVVVAKSRFVTVSGNGFGVDVSEIGTERVVTGSGFSSCCLKRYL
jgi:hypothetical protein